MREQIIRPITWNDYDAIREIDIETQIQYLGQEKWNKLTSAEKENNLVVQQSNFGDFVKNGFCFLVENEGKILGFILAYESVPIFKEIYCKYIALSPASQGKGIGGILFQELIEKARKNNIKRVWSLINLDNPNSINAHLKAGFKLKDRKEAEYII